MGLSNELISQFAKLTNNKKENKEATVKATYIKRVNGVDYVRLDGADSNVLTPVKTTVDAEAGDKVSVLIKEHTATIMGNISSPSARATVVENLKDEVDEYGNTIQRLDTTIAQQNSSIIQIETNIHQQQTTINQYDTKINQQGDTIISLNNTMIQQGNSIESINNTIVEHDNQINSIGNTIDEQGNIITSHNNILEQYDNRIKQNSNNIEQQGNQIIQNGNRINQQNDIIQSQDNKIISMGNIIDQQNNIINQHNNTINQHDTSINTANANINILNSGFTIENGVLTGLSSIIVNDLIANKINASYAKIDFSNIGIAAIQKLFTDSGIIRDLVVQQGHITGELVGVTIKGDLIESNTLKADKLVVKGSDGLYYKLNIDGINNISTSQAAKFVLLDMKPSNWDTNWKDYYIIFDNEYVHVSSNTAPTWNSNTYYKLKPEYESSLDGTNIVAKTITADKVAVNDLVAFGATIGGFEIGQHSIHSIGKNTVKSLAQGLYMDDSGQFSLGDDENYVVYEIDPQTGESSLSISADDIYLGKKQRYISDELDNIEENVNNLSIDTSNFVSNLQDKWENGEYDSTGKPKDNSKKIRYKLSIPVEHGETYQIQVFGPDEYVIFMTEYSINNQGESSFINSIDGIGHDNIEWICNSIIDEIRLTIHNIGSYSVLANKPNEWSTTFINYYEHNETTDTYTKLTGDSAPEWEENKYYEFNDAVSLNEIDNTIHIKIEKATKPSNFSYSYNDINTKINNAENAMQEYSDSKNSIIEEARSKSTNAYNETIKLKNDYNKKIAEYDSKIADFDTSIQKNKTNIELMASLIGGNNLIRNSVGFNETEYWTMTKENDATIETNQSDLDSVTISHSEFILTGKSTLTQNITLEENQIYNLSARIKHMSSSNSLNAVHIYAKIPGEEPVDLLYWTNTNEETGISTIHDCTSTKYDIFTKFNNCEFSTKNNSVVEISIENSGNDIFEVSDLMLAIGTIPPVWSQHKEEIYGKTMILDVEGLKVYPKTTTNIKNTRHTKTTDTGFSTIEYSDGIEKETSVLNKERMLTKIGYMSEAHVLLEDGTDLYRLTTVHVSDDTSNGHYDIIEY